MNNVEEIRGEAETECLGLPSDPDYCHNYANGDDYEMANGDDYAMANGDDYAFDKGKSKAAIVLKNDRLYLQFGAKAETNQNHLRHNKIGKSQVAYQDYFEIIGGTYAWPHQFPSIVRIIGGCAKGKINVKVALKYN